MSEIEVQILEVIDKVRPYLLRDGGDLEYIAFNEGLVYIKMLGACSDCLSLDDTITMGVEAILMEEVPGVKGVRVVND
ncbi:MAG: NifU family protein [Erysipelotrichaceae bacterium]